MGLDGGPDVRLRKVVPFIQQGRVHVLCEPKAKAIAVGLFSTRNFSFGLNGIDTLTAAVGRNTPHDGSDCKAALPPDSKRLGPKRLEDAARQQVALDIEGVLDSGVNREEALG